jgi:hypothetical protein
MTVAQLKRRVTIKCTGCAIERMQKTLRFTADWLAGQMTVKWNTRAPAAPPREVVEASTCMSEQGGAKSAVRVGFLPARVGRLITPQQGFAILAKVSADAVARRQAAFDEAVRRESALDDA